jgi:hypothetical protein
MSVATASYDLGDACDALAQKITTIRNGSGWTETLGQTATLDQLVSHLQDAADNARTAGVAASLAEATTPLARLSDACAQAGAAVSRLKAVNEAITLAGSLLSLAASAAIGDLAGIGKSAAAVVSEVKALS